MFRLVLIAILLTTTFALVGPKAVEAYTKVRSYFRSSGTYVQPHYRSDYNSSKWDNWSTKGNVNPFTGKKGYKNPYSY